MEKKIYLEPMANVPWGVLDFIYPRGPAGGAQVVSASPELAGKQVAVCVIEAYDSGIIRDGVLVWYQGTVADITDYDFLLEDAVRVQAGGSRKTPAVKRWPGKRAAVEKDALVMAQQYVLEKKS